MQDDALGVSLDRRRHVQNTNLDEAGAHDALILGGLIGKESA
jgi:hypothetical protein